MKERVSLEDLEVDEIKTLDKEVVSNKWGAVVNNHFLCKQNNFKKITLKPYWQKKPLYKFHFANITIKVLHSDTVHLSVTAVSSGLS